MILDATAGNRTMWNWKNSPDIIYLDVEKRLQRKPTIIASNGHLPFKAKSISSIFFDPPHAWNIKGHYHSYPAQCKEYFNKWHDKAVPRYYGWDRYKTKGGLIAMIHYAQREFYRVLKDDGLLWFKWNDMKTSIRKIIPIFNLWIVMLFLYVNDPTHTGSTHQTYWICMTKEKGMDVQTTLG
uniref:Putative methyltransferase n=1 Tax=viral metagenome TaxID=1070528 RepID=A0A6H1ZMT4_9ZZZZ